MSDLFGSSLPHAILQPEDMLDALRLIRSEQVGAITFHKLLRRYGSPARALELWPEEAVRRSGKRSFILCSAEAAQKELEKAAAYGATPILYGTPEYPARLAQLVDAPPILFVLGNAELLQTPRMLAVVGARNASAHGYSFARQIARDGAQAGYGIVSGLARGIDAGAHSGALEVSGPTIGVIAGGIDTRYPPENAALYDRMMKEGAIVTEQPFGMAPQARSFPARNRIIAGLAQATLVVEGALRSGSLITAECAAEAGREVFAVPGSPLDPRAQGTNQLLKQGAHLTESFADIVAHWPQGQIEIFHPRTNLHRSAQAPESGFSESLPDAPEAPPAPANAAENLASRIRAKLGPSMVLVDELAAQCNVAPGALQAILVELELDGTLLRGPGNRVALRP